MRIRVPSHDIAKVFDLEGELDDAASTELEERCRHDLQEGARHFVLDLGGLGWVSASGLRVLLGLARSLPRSGGSLVLCGLQSKVDEALEVSGLKGSFVIASDRSAALDRSAELQSSGRSSPAATKPRSALDEQIDLAIQLLGSNQPADD